MKLWGGRFTTEEEPGVHRLNASLPFDIRLYAEDLEASQAWAQALVGAGTVSSQEGKAIIEALADIRADFEAGRFRASPDDEDIHTAVERLLTERLGPLGGRLHTGRSRNDQVATDFRMWVMRACRAQVASLEDLIHALIAQAEAGLHLPMPGHTHLQPAQPITWGHWALAHAWPLLRDRQRFEDAWERASVMPLGSGALAGTTIPVDRDRLAESLGFDQPCPNSVDGVSDRDFALDFLFACSVCGAHLSRLAEQLILYNSHEFGFVSVDESYSTGSSLMPQKKNPDTLELARGKTGRLIGNLTSLLATLKALPSVYDKDLQEDKEPVFDSHDTLMIMLPVLAGTVRTLHLHPDRMRSQIPPECLATDLADYLVERGVPFREAHVLVGEAVRAAEVQGCPLSELPLDVYGSISEAFGSDLYEVFDLDRAIERRDTSGGTSTRALKAQLRVIESRLGEDRGHA